MGTGIIHSQRLWVMSKNGLPNNDDHFNGSAFCRQCSRDGLVTLGIGSSFLRVSDHTDKGSGGKLDPISFGRITRHTDNDLPASLASNRRPAGKLRADYQMLS
jgi:hypothetical protein